MRQILGGAVGGPVRGPVRAIGGHVGGGPIVPGRPIGLWLKKNGMTDGIGLSVSDYERVAESLRPLFFGAGPTLLDSATIIANIESSILLNDSDLNGNSQKGYSLHAAGTSADIITKTRKYWGTLPGRYYHGLNIYGVYQTWIGLPIADFYLDPENGNDANDGDSVSQALASVDELLSRIDFSGAIIAVAAGSTIPDMLSVTALSGITVFSYGTGRRACFDASDIVPNASFTLYDTDTYSISFTSESGGTTSVWENGIRFLRATDAANCVATPNSFYAPTPSAGVAKTILVHTSAGAIPSNGREYRISSRSAGINLPGDFSTIKFCRTKSQTGPDGSSVVGTNATIFESIFEDGTKHNFLMKSGAFTESVCHKGEVSAAFGSSTLFVGYADDPTNLEVTLNKSLIKGSFSATSEGQVGIYAHGTAGKKYRNVRVIDSAISGVNQGMGGEVANYVTMRNHLKDIRYGITLSSAITYQSIDDWYDCGKTGMSKDLWLAVSGGCDHVTIDGMRLCSRSSVIGLIGSGTISASISGSVLAFKNKTGWPFDMVNAATSGTLTVNTTIFYDGTKAISAGATAIYTGDNNVFYPSTIDMKVAGVTYNDVASYKAAYPLQDINSITSDPLLTDPINGDFSLQSQSPAIAIGAGLERQGVQYLDILSDEILAQW